MANISVIVAVYKMEQFLPRCIEGILGQTYRDLELILVDDGSPDNCGAICDAYAAKDSRVHVIHKQNAGVCAARNTGLDWIYEHSSSRWIFFHDNDDWIHPETLERLLAAAEENHTDISICGYQETEGEDPAIDPALLEPQLWTPHRFYREKFINATVCWGKLYSKDCFEGVRYPAGKYIEDEFVTYRLLFGCEQLAVIPAPLYAYYINRAGISKKAWVPKRLDAWEAYEQQIAFFENRGETELVRFRYRGYLENALVNLRAAEGSPNADELTDHIKRIRKHIRKLIPRAWKQGCIEFWPEFDMLYEFYPIATKVYRLWLEIKK